MTPPQIPSCTCYEILKKNCFVQHLCTAASVDWYIELVYGHTAHENQQQNLPQPLPFILLVL